jgi:SNF2 family DNA or RNA helicase
MGLGKTLQALVAIALAHDDSKMSGKTSVSIVVCPSSVVGHWIAEIRKFFPIVDGFSAHLEAAEEENQFETVINDDAVIAVVTVVVKAAPLFLNDRELAARLHRVLVVLIDAIVKSDCQNKSLHTAQFLRTHTRRW